MTKEAMKLALEALETCGGIFEQEFDLIKVDAAINALREELAKPDFWEGYEPEPVKWSDYEADGMHHNKPVKCKYPKCSYPCLDLPDCRDAEHPTTEQSSAVQPAQQEPVATIDSLEQEIYENTREFVSLNVMEWLLNRLNTSPPAQRKPLTDEQIVAKALFLSGLGTSPDVLQFARAIEAAHGIKENT